MYAMNMHLRGVLIENLSYFFVKEKKKVNISTE